MATYGGLRHKNAVVLVKEIPAGERAPWRALLELADEPEPLARYLDDGILYGTTDDDGRPLAAVLVILEDNTTAELRAVAVAEHAQGRGIGTWLINAVHDALRGRGITTVRVGTSSLATRELIFYQRLGFRLSHIDRDYFNAARGYPPGLSYEGIPLRDMVWMDQTL
ncbi:MAG TPA: GNAT family N-acetyltransferase [Acidimicrobiia bacterium]|nr:GNAT family N-acetyltransferase [Acidimicrobiia bacterium]